jgi:hypothetical protein
MKTNAYLKTNIQMKIKTTRYILNIVITFVIIYIIFYLVETSEDYTISMNKRNLERDGFIVLYDKNYANTKSYPSTKLARDVLDKLPDGYQFIDYVYTIEDAALSTFHRDVTSSKSNYKTKYPVYTLILYKYDGALLSVCPGSDKTYPFVMSTIVNITGVKGTAFLFDCDLLHAGCKNNCKERNVIQYKICHAEDLSKLSHLNGVRVNKKQKCKMSLYEDFLRKCSYFFEFPINYFFYPLMVKREDDNTIIGKLQSFIPLGYYNNI